MTQLMTSLHQQLRSFKELMATETRQIADD
jgi:hypothetical protein